jgi:Tfp pilus assembly protein PilV
MGEPGLFLLKPRRRDADIAPMRSLTGRAVRRLRRSVRDDSGFSLIEAVVALFIAAVAFTALAAAGLSSVKGSLIARQNQQASDFMAREMEQARALDFGSLANVATDLTGDPDVQNCSGKPCVDPGTGTPEVIWTGETGTGGAISQHVKTVTGAEANQSDYTVKTYVTQPADSYGADYRRVTVVAEWTAYGKSHQRRISSIVAFSQLGLPLPVFKLTPQGATTLSVNPVADVVFGFKLTNQGAPDRFSLSENDAHTWTWVFDNGDGVFTASDTTAVTDTNADGVIDTGRLNPNESRLFWVQRSVTTTGTVATVWTATSVAQPSAEGASQTANTSVTGTTGTVTPPTTSPPPSSTPPTDCTTPTPEPTPSAASGYTKKPYYLRNLSTPANSTAQALLDLTTTAPTTSTLYQYSTDVMSAQPGRVLTTGGTFSTGTAAQRGDWRYPVGRKAYSGTATLSLWAASPVGSTVTAVNLTAYVYKWVKSGSTYTATTLATIPLTVSPHTCLGFQKVVGVSPSFTQAQLSNNSEIGLRIVNSGTSSVRIAYDVAGLYPATLVLPEM